MSSKTLVQTLSSLEHGKSPAVDPVASNPRKRYAWDHDFNPGSGGGGGF